MLLTASYADSGNAFQTTVYSRKRAAMKQQELFMDRCRAMARPILALLQWRP
jgi:hypothetical protein